MKKILLTTAVILTTLMSFATPPKVSEKVLASFNNDFTNISGASWMELDNYYEVRFIQNSIDTRVMYDRSGEIVETIRYYRESGLPLLIKNELHDQYPQKKIFGVTELAKDGALIYLVVLEDDNSWTTVLSDSFGNTSVYKNYKKQN